MILQRNTCYVTLEYCMYFKPPPKADKFAMFEIMKEGTKSSFCKWKIDKRLNVFLVSPWLSLVNKMIPFKALANYFVQNYFNRKYYKPEHVFRIIRE